MTRTIHSAGAAALVAALLMAPMTSRAQDAAVPADAAKVTALESAVRTLTSETGTQRDELDAMRAQLADRDAALSAAAKDLAARDAKIATFPAELAARDARIAALKAELTAATAEVVAGTESQRALSEQAETVAASAAAFELRLTEAETALAAQRGALLAARNDLGSAEAQLVGKDKVIAALATAGKELVAAGEEAARTLTERDAKLAELRRNLMAARNDLASAEAQMVGKDKEVAALVAAARELVAANEALSAPADAFRAGLKQNIGPETGVQIVDDRFIFPSDIAFVSGSARLTPAAREKALSLGREIAAATTTLPADGDWLLRVDGHTDRQPVGGRTFGSNRELSAARAMEVVEVLTEAGVPPARLAPAAFGEFRPLDPTDTAEAYQANRRIELRLDEH